MNYKKLLYILIVLSFTSCKTADNVAYFQNINNLNSDKFNNTNYESNIVEDDLLNIIVTSIDPSAVVMFNVTNLGQPVPYLVDNGGYINYPVLGKIHVAGKTRSEVVDMLEKQISNYVKSPIIDVKIANYKVSVLGEVMHPGTFNVPSERVTILDAISLAGDLTIYGDRKKVTLIRENMGKKEYHVFDLTNTDLLNSPYYYLKQNDVVYVEPNHARKGNAKFSQNAQFNISLASTIIGAISVIASLTIALLVK